MDRLYFALGAMTPLGGAACRRASTTPARAQRIPSLRTPPVLLLLGASMDAGRGAAGKAPGANAELPGI